MSGNKVVRAIKDRIGQVLEYGYPRNNGTIEVPAAVFVLTLKSKYGDNEESILSHIVEEMASVVKFYEEDLKLDYEDKYRKEYQHYEFLRHGMLHQINKTFYFHPQETIESRKFIIFSDDCISSIQFLCRPEKVYLLVHMRSSDLINLFSLDLAFLINLVGEVITTHNIQLKDRGVEVYITLGSAHIYDKDMERAKNAVTFR